MTPINRFSIKLQIAGKLARKTLLAVLMVIATYSSVFANSLNIDYSQTSVSGLSSGAYMATQFHRAHGDTLVGAAIISAGPYYCAQGALTTALQNCINKAPESFDESLFNFYTANNNEGNLATKEQIQYDKIWILHGTKDTRITRKANDTLVKQYKSWVQPENLKYIDDKAFAHVFPTISTGGACEESASPFIGQCNYDAAGQFLAFIYGKLSARVNDPLSEGDLIEINQSDLIDIAGTGLNEKGFVYLPHSCKKGEPCKLHISFHGCNQSIDNVGDTYAKQTGINEWAASNNIIVLYPQIEKSSMFPMNPQACWDWWGYTDSNYANKEGSQIKAIYNLMLAIPNAM